VCEIDSMTAESVRQRSRTRRRKGPIDVKVLNGDSGAVQLPREPSIAMGRQEHDVHRAPRLELTREIRDDTFGATGPVGLDQMREPKA
jgi:hypothetical protein